MPRYVQPLHVLGGCGEFYIDVPNGALRRFELGEHGRHTCGYGAAEVTDTRWAVDGERGHFVCPECFLDANGFVPEPGLEMCMECFERRTEQGCACTMHDEYDEYEREYDPDPFVEAEAHDSIVMPGRIEGGHGTEPEARETTDDDPDVPMGSLLFRSLANRPMRMVSFEQEIGKGGNYIAEQLYHAGLTTRDYMMSYHSSREFSDDERPFVTVEEDSSVAAELVWSCMELDKRDHATKLETGLEIVRQAMKEKRVQLDMRCGGHIHVDVPDYFPPDAASVHVLWSYLEDPVFRLSAANWKCHRTEIQSRDYAPPVPKGGVTKAQHISNAANAGRAALNYGHLFQAWEQCRCGATRWGLWDECTCRRRQSTLEFRVFNTTANPTKLRAFIALAVGIVQYAKDNECKPERFPAMEWNRRSDRVDVPNSVERLSFILSELPMEQADRDAVRYCIERSSLGPCAELLNDERG